MKKFVLAATAVSALTLSACVSQEQADAKMEKGCQAAVEAMIAPRSIKEVKATSGENEKTMGSTYRRIKVSYVKNDDFAESVREGSCLFSQQWGFLKSSHTALLEQVKYNDQIIGKVDGNVQGSMDDFVKLTEKVDTAMSSN